MDSALRKSELKAKILELLSQDKKFRAKVIEFISKHKNDIVTTTYLDRALEKLSKEFDEKLLKQSERLSKEFDEKLLKQSERLSKEFDEKLLKQSNEFDEKLLKLEHSMVGDMKQYFDSRVGKIGGRWGLKMEEAVRLGLQTLLERDLKVKVSKWKYSGIIEEVSKKREQYEVDVYIMANGDVILCEVKSFVREGDVENFYRNCLAYEIVEKKIISRKIIIAPEVENDNVKRLAKNYSIEIV